MATSYKTLWQEANRELERVKSLAEGVVDLAGIASHMHVERFTPQQWKQRGHLPPVDFPEIKEPLWYTSSIKYGFAEKTGRLWCDKPTSLYAVGCDNARSHTRAL